MLQDETWMHKRGKGKRRRSSRRSRRRRMRTVKTWRQRI